MDTVTQGTGLERTSVGVVRRVFEALTTEDVVPVEEFISSDYIDHDTRGGRVAYPEMATLGFARRWNGCIACSEM